MKRHWTLLACSSAITAGLVGVSAATQADRSFDPRTGPSEEARLQPQPAKVAADLARDPRGGPPWAVQEYATTDARVCAKPGRYVEGRVGLLNDRGQLVGDNLESGGDCLDPEQLKDGISYHISTQWQDPRTQLSSPVTFIWGHARADVARVDIESETATESVAVRGSTYLAVVPGVISEAVTLRARLEDGGTETVVTPAVPEAIRKWRQRAPKSRGL